MELGPLDAKKLFLNKDHRQRKHVAFQETLLFQQSTSYQLILSMLNLWFSNERLEHKSSRPFTTIIFN